MSAFLQRLAARSLSALPLLEPRRSSRFEPADAPPVAGETPVLASGRKPEPEPQDPEPAGRVPETRPPGPAPASKDTLDQDRASPQPSPRPNATDAPGAPPRVILQLREAPRLVVEPPLPPASGPAAFPAPFPTPEPPLPLLESRPAPQLLARLPQGQPVVSPGPRRAAAQLTPIQTKSVIRRSMPDMTAP